MQRSSNYSNSYLTNTTNNTYSNNIFPQMLTMQPTGIIPIQQGQISRIVGVTSSSTLKRTADDASLTSAAKRPRVNVEDVLTPTASDNNQIILFCEKKIEENDWKTAKDIILNNENLTANERVNLCNKLCTELLKNNLFAESNKIINYISISKNSDNNALSDLLNKFCIGYYQLNMYPEAEQVVNRALSLASDKRLRAKLYNNLSMICSAQGNFSSAIEAAKNGLRLAPLTEECKKSLQNNLKSAKDAQLSTINNPHTCSSNNKQ